MAYSALGRWSFICILGFEGCGGNVGDAKASAVTSGGTPSTNNSVAGAGPLDAGGRQDSVGPDNQFILVDDETVASLRAAACQGGTWECEPDPLATELVVDLSAAAQSSASNDWQVMQSVLVSFTSFRVTVADSMGVEYFPNRATEPNLTGQSSTGCIDSSMDVPLERIDSNHSAAILQSVSAAKPQTAFGAPIHDAYAKAVNLLLAQDPSIGQRAVVLVTEGIPTLSEGCKGEDSFSAPVDPSPIISAIDSARQSGIRTVVVGAPRSAMASGSFDARPWLSEAARAGGTSAYNCNDNGPNYCHVDLAQTTDLAPALSFTNCAIQCTMRLPAPPAGTALDLNKVSVLFQTPSETDLIRMNSAEACEYGWHLSNDYSSIEICPGTCAALQSKPNTQMILLFGCAHGPVIP